MPDRPNIAKVHPITPESGIINQAGKILADNGIVIFPARCLYGVAVNAFNETAVNRVFHLKQRPLNNPLLVLVKDLAMIEPLVKNIPSTARRLMDTFWPGRLTLVFQAMHHLPEPLTAGTGKIGIRIPSHPVARALVDRLDFPVTGTSANLSGMDGCTRIDQLDPSIIEQADLILDAGKLKGGQGSTIADVTGNRIKIIRTGEISSKQIENALVCF